MGPQLMRCCKPEQVGTQLQGEMLQRIQVLEDGRVPAKEAKHGTLTGQRENHEKRVSEAFE